MKVYLYSQFQKSIENSGIGRARLHQEYSLSLAGVEVVDDFKESDLIHINTIFPGTPFLIHWARCHDKKVIMHAHSTKEDFRNSFIGSNLLAPLFGKWIYKLYSMADMIITPSEYAKRILLKNGIEKPIYPLSNGIDLNFYQEEESYRDEFRKKYGYSKEQEIIMSVGLWIKRKGILDFVDMAKSMPEKEFIWFGETNLKMVPQDVRTAIKNPPSNLKFPGYVSREELRQAYFACDLFFFPSYEETEGIVILEALACKIPILIRDIPVYHDWLKKNKDVYMASNNESFKEYIIGILNGDLEDLSEVGYLVAQERSFQSIGNKLKRIYNLVLEDEISSIEELDINISNFNI